MKKWLTKINEYLFIALPFVVFFSYYPVFRLGQTSSMNLELSLPLIWLAVFGAVSFLRIKKIVQHFPLGLLIITTLFPAFASLSILWSSNHLRGALTAAIVWLIYFSILNILSAGFSKKVLKKAENLLLLTAACVGGFCVLQCILDAAGVSQQYSLLCMGCTYGTFGFSHPNGFAIEPQFMGNLLILPAILSLKKTYYAIKSQKGKGVVLKSSLLSFWLIMVLFICFSRGAIYAFMLAVIYMIASLCITERSFKPLLLSLVCGFGFCAGLFFQGVDAKITPTNIGFREGVARSIHHLSLGKVDFRRKEVATDNQTVFNGYIEESTEIRMSLNEAALKAWRNSPIVGFGLGSAGHTIAEKTGYYSEKEIIQNEYLSVLLELGVVGIILLVLDFVIIAQFIIKKTQYIATKSSIVAFLLTLMFFSGLPNALHIYLLTPVISKLERKRIV